VHDNTDQNGAMTGMPFDTLGVGSVHWTQPAAWTVQDPKVGAGAALGITGYWVAMDIVTVFGGDTPPWQQHRDIYSIVWPYVEVQSTEVGGDVVALLTSLLHNQSGDGTRGVHLYTSRVIAGLRSISRGSAFQAYLNLSNTQVNVAVTVIGPNTAFAADVTAPTGVNATYAPGVNRTMRNEAYITIATATALNYRGRFKVLLRCQQTGGAAGDIGSQVNISMQSFGNFPLHRTDIVYTRKTGEWETLEMGVVNLPPFPISGSDATEDIVLVILLSNTNGAAASLLMYDLILIPVDEWAVDVSDNYEIGVGGRQLIYYPEGLQIDSLYIPKRTIRSTEVEIASGNLITPFRTVASGPTFLQANSAQRIWVYTEHSYNVLTDIRNPAAEICQSAQMTATQRYESMRGNR